MKKRLTALTLGVLTALSFTFNSFALVMELDTVVVDEGLNGTSTFDGDEAENIFRETFAKYGIVFDDGEWAVMWEEELKDINGQAYAEAYAKIREAAYVHHYSIPDMEQKVYRVGKNTRVFDDGFKAWTGLSYYGTGRYGKDRSPGEGLGWYDIGHSLSRRDLRVVTTETINDNGTATINWKVYNTDNELVDTNKYYVLIDIIGGEFIHRCNGVYTSRIDDCQESEWWIDGTVYGNDVSVTFPGKIVGGTHIMVVDKTTYKLVSGHGEIHISELPYVAEEEYLKVFEPYKEAVSEYYKNEADWYLGV